VQYVLSGGGASGTIVNGGNEQVLSGGSATGATVSNGGFLVVSSGGTINGATISGATLEIASGGLTGANPITYAGGAALTLDQSTTFSGTVAGLALGDYLDLRDISFISGTTSATFSEAVSNTSGTLTVSDGTHIANLTLLGQYVTAQFHVTNDGHGGTVVTDPPLATATDAHAVMFANPHHT
jgi:autotransporter passenger strand-loop-strand repeat protein